MHSSPRELVRHLSKHSSKACVLRHVPYGSSFFPHNFFVSSSLPSREIKRLVASYYMSYEKTLLEFSFIVSWTNFTLRN